MPTDAAPRLLDVAEALLAELKELHGWIDELKADLAKSETRRIQLTQAFDSAVSALDPTVRREYERLIQALIGDLGPNRGGRPPADGRQGAVLQLIAEWEHEEISTAEVKAALRRHGMTASHSFVPGLMRRLESRGMVLRTARGRYRITRLHPHLVARRHGTYHRLHPDATEREGRADPLRPAVRKL